jgi:hypothetical protein
MSAMLSVQPNPQVLGVLFQSVPGLEPYYLAFEPGLTVMYGLNGAGKTRALDAIGGIWAGRESGAQLVVRLPEPEMNDDPDGPDDPNFLLVSQLQAAIIGAWLPTEQLGFAQPGMDLIETAYGMAITHGIGREFLSNIDPFTGPLDPDRWGVIQEELLEQRLVLIGGAGHDQSDPRWVAQPLAVEELRFPLLSAELHRIVDHRLSLQDGDPTPYLESADISGAEQLASTVGFNPFPMPGPGGMAMGTLTLFDEGGVPCEWVGLELLSADPPSHARLKDLISGNGRFSDAGDDLLQPGLTDLTDVAMSVVKRIREHANTRLQSVLLDAPDLNLRVRPVSDWWEHDPVVWEFGPSNLPLTAMSRAELKWAHWAINEAVHAEQGGLDGSGRLFFPRPASLLLLDEPEAALHRSAEANMATALAQVAAEPKRHVIAATHSPELLNLSSARLIQLRKKEDGRSSLVPLAGVDLNALHDLGLNPSDLLRRQRAFLLVEGEHDELVFTEMFGAELKEMRVEILPIRGARKLPGTIESRVLFDFTDAHLFVILDNLDPAEVASIWSQAQVNSMTNDLGSAGELLRAGLWKSNDEKAWLGQWLSRALETNRHPRVTPFGLVKADIIEYLPVQSLVPNAESWETLRAEHRRVVERGSKYRDFKQWLMHKCKAHFDGDSIVAATAAAEIPGEFTNIMAQMRVATDAAWPVFPPPDL